MQLIDCFSNVKCGYLSQCFSWTKVNKRKYLWKKNHKHKQKRLQLCSYFCTLNFSLLPFLKLKKEKKIVLRFSHRVTDYSFEGDGGRKDQIYVYVYDEKLTIKIITSSIVLFVFMFEVWDSFYVSVVRNFIEILLLDRPELLFPNNCILTKICRRRWVLSDEADKAG